ncbi:MAG: MFS transporter [Alistipes sp.]|nr:MFS transporter [Alistipes sp.]
MFKTIRNFYKTSAPVEPLNLDEKAQTRYYRKLSLQAFAAGTLGYSLYYVCRTSLNVMKKPILDSGMLDATQLGVIGSALLFAYAAGKFVNGFIADHCNIKRFMATGLLISTLANFIMGVLGLVSQSLAVIPTAVLFISFAVMWGINGWSQSMGAAPAIIALSRWFPLNRRGTFYGMFSASHNIGEWLSFIFVGSIVSVAGWQWGFFGSSIAGVLGVICILFFLHDTPESKGLPSIEVLAHEKPQVKPNEDVNAIQRQVLRNPGVYILALASAFMYISRYSLNSWGILFLQEAKGFSMADATFIISLNALLGIVGTVVSGWLTDVLFNGNRKIPALAAGILLSISYAIFIYGGTNYWVNVLSMVLFGIAIGVLISFLGGLMAVDIVPRKATGAALGIVGLASYIAAGIQDVVSGWLIDSNITETVNELGEVVKHYDFSDAAIFWIGASVISFLLPILNWGRKVQQEE